MRNFVKSILALVCLTSAASVCAEVTEKKDGHFITRDEVMVEADLKETWLALIAPAKWWNSAHTFTGDAENLTLTPQAGGCFCEKVPEVDEPGRFTLEGSVEHLRVINAQPEKALRLAGALGPLQSEPVRGVLTFALTKMDEGTRIVLEYNVAGPMRYEIDTISKAVDGVMTEQLNGLAKLLGRVDRAEDQPEDQLEEAGSDEEPEAEERETVEDAFGDLEGRDPGAAS